MKNRLLPILPLLLFLFLFATPQNLQAQFAINYGGPTSFVLNANCQATLGFGGQPAPVVVSTIGATILTPPSGFNAGLTGYNIGDLITGEQTVNLAYVAADDQGNSDTLYLAFNYQDNTPPVFTTPKPADIVIDCAGDFPPTLVRTALDNCDGSFLVNSTNTPMVPAASCNAPVTILRTWTAIDDAGNVKIDTQTITILPDLLPPSIGVLPSNATFYCNQAGSYGVWLSTQRNTILASATDNCNLITLSDNAPPTFDDPCGSVTVTFTVSDGCSQTATAMATYTAIDTLAPILMNVPADTIINCEDPAPAPAAVTATDDCDSSLPAVTFLENSTQTNTGACTDHNYTITRTWSIADECGNMSSATQTIQVIDDQDPTFTLPADTTITCDSSIDPTATGQIFDLADNCGTDLDQTFVDSFDTLSCPNDVKINRVWIVSDECGNATSSIQQIFLIDTVPPSFTPPADTVYVDCDQFGNPGLTGMPTDLLDQCDGDPQVTMQDDIFDQVCPHTYSVRRTWYVEDACGNVDSSQQVIFVQDTTRPVITFNPQDITIACTTDADADAAFADWIAAHGNSTAADNCSNGAGLFWTAFNGGTMDVASLPPPACTGDPIGIYRQQTVDFVVTDECGNMTMVSGTFTVVDDTPPAILACVSDTIVATDPGVCETVLSLPPPVVFEECGAIVQMLDYQLSQALTSPALPGQEATTPIDPMTFTFAVAPSPNMATTNVTLQVDLNKVDAEGATEFLHILGDDGSNLGQTVSTPAQCDSSVTMITIPAATYNLWAADGIVNITLTPNLPSGLGGQFSVNNICPGGTADVSLSYTATGPADIRMEYSIDGGARIPLMPIGPITDTFPLGTTTIDFYIIDCAGNEATCSSTVTVEDQEPPVVTCPADFSVNVDPGLCEASVQIPLIQNITDNCGATVPFDQTQPDNPTEALLTFSVDPNLGEYIADDKVFVFNGVTPNAVSPVTLTFTVQGDVDSLGEYFSIYDQMDNLLGTTETGQLHVVSGNCDTASVITFTISPTDFNMMAAGGFVLFVAESFKNFPFPPPTTEMGINPCVPGNVTANGDNDGLSFMTATLSYETLTPLYFAEGATTIPPTPVNSMVGLPTHVLNQGVTTISYVVEDFAGNPDTCSFEITVVDNELPTALCGASIIEINPSGLVTETIPPADIDMGSFDNCAIDSMYVVPNTITCDMIGDTLTAVLTVIDIAGNMASCSALVRVDGEPPMPSYSVGACGNDTLFLFANPPTSPGNNVYTYQWSGPNFSSTVKNPFIVNAGSANAGTYTVTITGLTGCSSTGEIQVAIDDLPLTPVLTFADDSICSNQNLVLKTTPISGGTVAYHWYSGVSPGGTFLATTAVASYTIPGPHTEGDFSYYVIVESDDCESNPSASSTVHITGKPVAETNDDVIDVCEGGLIQLGTFISGPDITYQWTGPGFTSNLQIPNPISPAGFGNDGLYTLTVFRNGCPSDPAFTVVNVLDAPNLPMVSNSTTQNNPACVGDTVTLFTNIPGATSYEWTSPNFTTFVTTTNTLMVENVTTQQAGNWTVQVFDNICSSPVSAPTTVYVEAPPNVSPTSNSPVCNNEQLQLMASNPIPGASYVWKGPNGNMYQGSTVTIPPVAGAYMLTVTSAAGCVNSATTNVVVNTAPVITSVSNNAPDCPQGPTNIQLFPTIFPANGGPFDFAWSNQPQGYFSTDSVAVIPNATPANNGSYTLIVTDANGCSSNPKTTVVEMGAILPNPAIPTTNEPGPFCEGDAVTISTIDNYNGTVETYFWHTPNNGIVSTSTPSLTLNDLTVDDAGNYLVTVEVDGCPTDSSGVLPLVVNPIPNISAFSNSPVCEGGVLELSTNCISGATYAWLGPGFSSSVCNPIVPNANDVNEGTYSVVVTVNGCPSQIASTNVIINDVPNLPVISNSGAVCIDDPDAELILTISPGTATPGAQYTWYNAANNQVIGGPTPALVFILNDFDGFSAGNQTFYAVATLNGCASSPSIPTSVMFNAIPPNMANAGPDVNSCEGQAAVLNATAPTIGVGSWSFISGAPGVMFSNPDAANTTVTGLIPGEIYLFQWSLTNGACVDYSQDTMQVIVDIIEQANAGPDIDTCEVNSVNLSATLPTIGGGMWTQPNGQDSLGVVIVDPTDPNTQILGLVPGNEYKFTWTTPDNGCGASSDFMWVRVIEAFTFAGDDYDDCGDGCTELSALGPDAGFGTWSSPNEEIDFSNPNNPNALACNLAVGDNVFIWTLNDGVCGEDGIDTVIVSYKMAPIAFDDEVRVEFAGSIDFAVDENDEKPLDYFVNILTQPSNGTLTQIGTNGGFSYQPFINFIGTDIFTYEICSASCDCSTAVVEIIVGEDARCEVPTIITPNGDGINDLFVVPCLSDFAQYPDNKVSIFNQWGDEVFHAAPYLNDWAGTYDGEDLPVGTYFFIVVFNSGEEPQTGFLIIQR